MSSEMAGTTSPVDTSALPAVEVQGSNPSNPSKPQKPIDYKREYTELHAKWSTLYGYGGNIFKVHPKERAHLKLATDYHNEQTILLEATEEKMKRAFEEYRAKMTQIVAEQDLKNHPPWPPQDPWGAYYKPWQSFGGKAPRKALPVKQPKQPTGPPKRKWKEECQAMSDAMKAIEESTLTKNDIREEIEAKKAAEERHMQTRERVGKRVRNSSEQVNDLFNEFKWRTEKVTSNGLVIDDDSDSD